MVVEPIYVVLTLECGGMQDLLFKRLTCQKTNIKEFGSLVRTDESPTRRIKSSLVKMKFRDIKI